ncbi:AraC family transcriptional regulator [Curtobacterium sp. PhB42]|uniref:helix-turn-helix domain-containing protein n=1 Tax=unclassified Curtobacterium TaxID=257496 RepID=UPI0010635438|nr:MULTISPECIES: helix-turn-helix domain-containing protein [unclassified Curtobacterium]TDW38490.1 AraC family transcriptional regulator [Curtobacterium sp. PhB42]TDW50397.1 AraC family transcriptional regulator [Curtobacterium sp. PhB190]
MLDVETMEAAYWSHRGPAPLMSSSHRHDDLEMNLVLDGHLDYRFGGAPVSVHAGEIALFWGWTPHQLVGDGTGTGEFRWVHIPLAEVLSWGLPDHDLGAMLLNRPVVVPTAAAGRDVESMLGSWQQDFEDDGAEIIANLEAQALVRRLLRHHRDAVDLRPGGGHGTVDAMHRVIDMVRFVVDRFREPIEVADVAAAAHLHPHYAMSVFRQDVGTTIVEYLTRCRVAEAQRLLATTSMTTSEIAHAAGFGSQSSFYVHFTRACGTAPGAYRARAR